MNLKGNKIKYLLLLFILIIFGLLLSEKNTYAAEWTNGDFTYTYENINGNAENVCVTKYKGNKIENDTLKSTTITIPSTLNGLNVVSIGDGVNTFLGIDISKALGFVGTENTTSISVNTIVLPNTLKSINDYAFYGIKINGTSKIVIPEGVINIGNYAFANIHYKNFINDLVIPNSVESIGNYAFANIIGEKDEYGLGILNPGVGHRYWLLPPNGMHSLNLGTGVKTIGKYAFANQIYLTELTIPQNVLTIGEDAFVKTSIQTLNIEDRTTTLNFGKSCFASTGINHKLIIKNNYNMSEGYVFANCNLLKEVEFENGITTIPTGTFYGCKSLTNIIKTNTITNIEYEAFAACTGLRTENYTNIIENITNIGQRAFAGCTGLTGTIEINNTITNLEIAVFEDCSNIENVQINANITEIPDGTFRNCTNLKNITKTNTITRIGDEAFRNCTSLTTEEYNDIKKNITNIGSYAFKECTGLTGTIQIDEIVTTLGNGVFSKCSNIEESIILANLTQIPYETYSECTSLKNITKPVSVKTIGKSAFYKCTEITMEEFNNIAQNITEFGDSSFECCTKMEGALNIKNIVEKIGYAAFKNCINITEIIFENGTNKKIINDQAFYNDAKNQKVVRIYASEAGLGTRAFTNIQELYISGLYESVSKEYRWYGDLSSEAIIHYGDCTHYIDITCTLPGIKLVNPTTNETLTSEYIKCESNYSFKVVIENEYKEKYKDLSIKLVSEGETLNSELTEDYITLDENNTYTINNVTRNKKIIVQANKNGTDLVLREFIAQINNKDLIENRDPNVQIASQKALAFEYNHTKYPLVVKKGDKITYTIRVYNEGKNVGKADEITVKLNNHFAFIEENNVNKLYNWKLSEETLQDGTAIKTIKTDYLKEKNIEAYTGSGKPAYEEIQFVCEVEKENEEEQYMVALAEITKGNDEDSLQDSINISLNNTSEENNKKELKFTNFMKTQAYTSSRDTYTMCIEDDTDFEAVVLNKKVLFGYNLVVNKIDSISSELLNGAQIRLLNENKEELQIGVTNDGTIDFGTISTYGEGIDTYYLEEVKTPVGYKKTIEGLIELQVIKTVDNEGNPSVQIAYDVKNKEEDNDFVIKVDNTKEFIPITTKSELLKIGTNENVTVNGKQYVFSKDANYQLQNDINLNEQTENTEPIKPIENMNGIFDGNNHTITGLLITEESAGTTEIGLFRTFSGEIRNLTIEVNYVKGVTTIEGKQTIYNQPAVGVFVGYMESGAIKNCTVKGSRIESTTQNVGGFVGHTKQNETVVFEQCNVNIKNGISGKYNVGGLVGCAGGNIIINNCTNNSSIQATEYNAGGLVGCATSNIKITKSNNNGVIPENSTKPSNIGGIIGYISQNGILNVEECNNTADISGGNNIGGIAGYSEGIVSIVNCQNTGNITSSKNNVGGIIGQSNVKGKMNSNVIVGYNENNKTIIVNIKNKETEGSYNLNILKVDLALGTKLAGAQFNIYNSNHELIKENAQVNEQGSLLINNINLNSLVSDVYYIKETKAPAGYEILVKDYVKIEVVKQWDSENEKYIISTKPIINITSNLEEVVLGKDKTKTGNIAEEVNYSNVRYKSNKTALAWCTNNGNVVCNGNKSYAPIEGSNAGGIAGLIKGYSIIEYCNNNTEENSEKIITSNGHTGGIVSEIMVNEVYDETTISNCNNKGNIQGSTVGGIIGINSAKTKVNNCENSGNIMAKQATLYTNAVAAGILASTHGTTYINECKNSGNISGAAVATAGIVANANQDDSHIIYQEEKIDFTIENKSIEITNCEVTQMQGSASMHYAGILATSNILNTVIKDCTVDNIKGGSQSAGGIISCISGENILVENCNVINPTINGKSTSGILATIWYGDNYKQVAPTIASIEINNCNVLGGAFSGEEVSGILGYTNPTSNAQNMNEFNITITNCNIKQDESGNKPGLIGKHVSGIYSGLITQQSFTGVNTNSNVQIKKCSVDSANIKSYEYGAGIMGNLASYDEGNKLINIEGCNLSNCTLESSGNYSSGIFGEAFISNRGKYLEFNIKDCNVIGTQIMAPNESTVKKASGICGFLYGSGVNIENCKVTNLLINNNASEIEGTFGTDNIYAGIFAGAMIEQEDRENVIINNCEVGGLQIEDTPGITAGIVGHVYGYSEDTVLSITNSKLISYQDKTTNEIKPNTFKLSKGAIVASGVIGGCNNTQVKIDNVQCSDLEVSNYNNTIIMCDNDANIASLIGNTCSITNFEVSNVDINNIKTNLNFNTPGGYRNNNYIQGGVIGVLYPNTDVDGVNLTDITVNNVNMTSNNGKIIGGLVGCWVDGKAGKIQNTTIENSNFKIENNEKESAVAGLIAIDCNPAEHSYENITINNVDLSMLNACIAEEDCTSHIAGLIGISNQNPKIKEVEINNVNITGTLNEEDLSKTINTAGVIASDNVSSLQNTSLEDVSINNTTINNLSEKGVTAGIVAVNESEEPIQIKNSNVNKLTATGKYAVGGILGTGIANINNCTVTNPKLTGNGANATVGAVAGVAVEKSKLDNITVTAEISEDETQLAEYGVFSDYIAAGMVAINSGSLSNSTVENIIVKSTAKTVEKKEEEQQVQEGNESAQAETTNGLIGIPHANEVQVLYLENFVNCIITNVKVICGN